LVDKALLLLAFFFMLCKEWLYYLSIYEFLFLFLSEKYVLICVIYEQQSLLLFDFEMNI